MALLAALPRSICVSATDIHDWYTISAGSLPIHQLLIEFDMDFQLHVIFSVDMGIWKIKPDIWY